MLIVLFSCLLFGMFLFCPIKIIGFYDNSLDPKYDLILRILFFKVSVKKFLNRKNSKKTNERSDKKTETDESEDKKLRFENLETVSNDISSNKDFVTKILKLLLKYVKIETISLFYIISSDDAAKTGLKYGKVNIAVYNIYNIFKEIFTIKKSNIYLYPDFVNEEEKIRFDIVFKISLFQAISIALIVFFRYKNIFSKKNKKDI